MKFYQFGRSIFRKMVQMLSYFATTCTTTGTRGAKLPVDATFSGRSMVEMLGVLAIIGVLSVGAIAGYSKAMDKYRWNKFTADVNIMALLSKQISLSEKVKDSAVINILLQKTDSLPGNFYVGEHATTHFYYTPNPGFNYGYSYAMAGGKVQICFFYPEVDFCHKMLQTPFDGLDWENSLGGILVIENESTYHKLKKMPSLAELDRACQENSERLCLFY